MLSQKIQGPLFTLHKKTAWGMVALFLIYLVFQLLYIPYAALSVDELWFAQHIFQYTHKLPYRDFLPYKTVLGYYLLSIPFYFSHAILAPLYYIKDELAIINTVLFAVTSVWLTRFFQPRAILLTSLLVIANQLFLIYSVDLRVDMLTCWLGLISFLFLLSNRACLAGLALAIGFLISQKALWFFAAANLAFFTYWLIAARNWQTVREVIYFNLCAAIPIALYLLFWSWLSSPAIVMQSVFYEGFTQAKITWYAQIYYLCWHVIMSNGPILVLLWPLTWISLLIHQGHDEYFAQRIFVTVYAFVMMVFIISYQQAFPYNIVFSVPVFLLIYADFFSWLFSLFKLEMPQFVRFNNRKVFWFISLYSISVISLMIALGLPVFYYMIAGVPILLGCFIAAIRYRKNNTAAIFPPLILIIVLFAGVLYPLLKFSVIASSINSRYQQSMITLSNQLIAKDGSYFAGTPLLYQHDQAIDGLKNLIGPTIEYLNKPSHSLLPIFIPSLYLVPRTVEQVIHDLKATPVKFYVNNYRIVVLPASLHDYLNSTYLHFWGSIYLYAPSVSKHQHSLQIPFYGKYEVLSDSAARIYIDDKKVAPHSEIVLSKNKHRIKTDSDFRLKLIADKTQLELNPDYQNDAWSNLVKAIVM
ncbi:MAG: hypothetical protein ABI370_08245 [Gammaproteobacteria bacterium]